MTYPYQEHFQNVEVTYGSDSAAIHTGTVYLTVTPYASTNTLPPVINYLPQTAEVGDVLVWDGQNWNPGPSKRIDPLTESTLREMAKLNGAGFIGLI